MTIYIGLPNGIDISKANLFKSKLAEVLKKYYGNITSDEIKLYYSDEPDILVSVMEKAKFPGQDKNIKSDICMVEKAIFPQYNCRAELNVQQIRSDFDPCTSDNAVGTDSDNKSRQSKKTSEEFDYEKLSQNYHSEEPRYSFEQVILPEKVREQILEAVGTIQVEEKVFDEWGLRSIIPNASSAISFYGPPGTGKSMTAEAIAQHLGKKILKATYADIESKFHGEGPKMVKAIFRAAERDEAVLFLDESDSLLSKRLTNVSDGSAQAINSMRSQLLICLEQFRGIVIFATNLVINYDKAFLSRLINIEFPLPDFEARKAIWHKHLLGEGLRIPLSEDINIDELAEKFNFCGREIKNSVKDACVTAAIADRDTVTQADLIKASEKTKTESEKVMKADDHTKANLSKEQKKELIDVMQKKIDTANEKKLDEMSGDPNSAEK